jgi:hypothetical protein
MKFLAVLFAMLFMFSCAGVEINTAAEDVLVKVAGHRAGFELGKADMSSAVAFITASDVAIAAIETGDVTGANALIHEAINKLAAEIAKKSDDPALTAEIMILSEMVVFKGDMPLPGTDELKAYLVQMKSFMSGFKLGVMLATAE